MEVVAYMDNMGNMNNMNTMNNMNYIDITVYNSIYYW